MAAGDRWRLRRGWLLQDAHDRRSGVGLGRRTPCRYPPVPWGLLLRMRQRRVSCGDRQWGENGGCAVPSRQGESAARSVRSHSSAPTRARLAARQILQGGRGAQKESAWKSPGGVSRSGHAQENQNLRYVLTSVRLVSWLHTHFPKRDACHPSRGARKGSSRADRLRAC